MGLDHHSPRGRRMALIERPSHLRPQLQTRATYQERTTPKGSPSVYHGLPQAQDATRVCGGLIYLFCPLTPRGQVDSSSATAELWDDPEKGHVEVAHADVDLVLCAQTMTPIQKGLQLTGSSVVRDDIAHVHGHGANVWSNKTLPTMRWL